MNDKKKDTTRMSEKKQTSETDGMSRRSFLKTSSAATGLLLSGSLSSFAGKKEKAQVAFVATGGRAGAHVRRMANSNLVDCPCYCDVDTNRQKKAAKAWNDAKAYQDYRKMFQEMHEQIDAVFVSTPDHHHFPASMMAMKRDIHVYCEKPLTWCSWEARKMREVANKRNLVTQMGNQRHALMGWRKIVGLIRGGAIGEVKEVHSWTNRPVWPQGIQVPNKTDKVPASLDWNIWLGPARKRPYVNGTYHPFNWRGWYDFGAGALGDMACHIMDGMFWALDAKFPESVELMGIKGHTSESFPVASTVKWSFPKKGKRPAFDAYWYDGKPKYDNKPKKPEGADSKRWNNLGNGNLFVGTKGKILASGYGQNPTILPSARAKEVGKPDPKLMPDPSPGHHKEFLLAVTGQKSREFPKTNFNYSGPMTEVILMGVVAQRLGNVGKTLKLDGDALQITNDEKANALLKRNQYRDGWDVT